MHCVMCEDFDGHREEWSRRYALVKSLYRINNSDMVQIKQKPKEVNIACTHKFVSATKQKFMK